MENKRAYKYDYINEQQQYLYSQTPLYDSVPSSFTIHNSRAEMWNRHNAEVWFSYWYWRLNWCNRSKQGCTLVEVRCSLWAAMTVEDTSPDHLHMQPGWEQDSLDLLENQRRQSFWWFTILAQIIMVILFADLTSLLIWGWWSGWHWLASTRWVWQNLVWKVLTALNDGWRRRMSRHDRSCCSHSCVKNQMWSNPKITF